MIFEPYGKIPRLQRPIVVSEKIDGTNAQILIEREGAFEGGPPAEYYIPVTVDGEEYCVMFGSRKKYIKTGDDNFGFAAFFTPKAADLVRVLGEGRHYGEWWGIGIQRGYGMVSRQFSLFNTYRWEPHAMELSKLNIRTVPVLYAGPMCDTTQFIDTLKNCGSFAAPGYDKPEGIVIWHEAARMAFKQTVENDDKPKGQA